MLHSLATALLGLALSVPALAGDEPVVGTWRDGPVTLHVQSDGHFGWHVGPEVTDGRWKTDRDLVSMETERTTVTYAYRIDGDTLTLFDPSGAEVVMERARRRPKKR